MMGQINPAGFQFPMCMFYVYVIVENTFDLTLTLMKEETREYIT